MIGWQIFELLLSVSVVRVVARVVDGEARPP